jgi:DNA-directed RNA polymerase specialized sigma24 family protein
VEIAYRLIYRIPRHDQDDVEQEIVIILKQVTERRGGDVGEDYLWGVARNVVRLYWRKRCRQAKRLLHFYPSNRGEMVAGRWTFVSDDGDAAARMDAAVMLATLPQRLVEIGYKRLNGEELNTADECYWMRQKAKLNCRRRGDQLSDWEKRRVAKLHNEGYSVSKIALALGRGRKSIDLCLVKAGLREAPPYLARKLMDYVIRNSKERELRPVENMPGIKPSTPPLSNTGNGTFLLLSMTFSNSSI